uniref:Transposase n=1 Tax=Ditylenchus dipsaci TaxID=166011 RepID=A0A915DF57_9BILA
MARRRLLDTLERPDVAALRLKEVFSYDTEQSLIFFVGLSVIRNEALCDICASSMMVEKNAARIDGIQWRCRKQRKMCSRKSIRSASFFFNSHLRLQSWLLIFYMWANDYSNQQIVKEAGLSAKHTCDWLNLCREVCQKYFSRLISTIRRISIRYSGKGSQEKDSVPSDQKTYHGRNDNNK